MSEPARDDASTLPAASTPVEERGVTEIAARVVEKLAVRLASEVPGVVNRRVAGLRSALPGGSTSSTAADAEVGRSTTRVALRLDLHYPSPVDEVVEHLRAHVRDGLLRLTGLSATRLDVTVCHLVPVHGAPRAKGDVTMRLANRLVATAVAAVIAALSALIALEIIIGYYFDRDPWLLPWDSWNRRSRELSWSDRSVVVTFVLIGVAGIVLLAAELWKRAPVALPLTDGRSDVHTQIDRRSLEHALTRTALQVDGISSANVRLGRRRVTLHASTDRRMLGDLRARVTQEVERTLGQLRLQQPPRLSVSVSSSRAARQLP